MIIYIVGYGRSGTTRLARVLEDRLNAVNLGELKYLYRTDKDDLLDAFWVDFKAANIELLEKNASTLFKFDSLFGLFLWRRSKDFKALWDEIFEAIGVDPDEDVVIDSSKSNLDAFMRGIYLRKNYKEVAFIKPGRKVSGILRSLAEGKNSDLERGIKKGFMRRLLHTAVIGLPHFLITGLLTHIYRFYGLTVVDMENMEEEIEKFIQNHNIQKSPSAKNIPMLYGNRSRKNTGD